LAYLLVGIWGNRVTVKPLSRPIDDLSIPAGVGRYQHSVTDQTRRRQDRSIASGGRFDIAAIHREASIREWHNVSEGIPVRRHRLLPTGTLSSEDDKQEQLVSRCEICDLVPDSCAGRNDPPGIRRPQTDIRSPKVERYCLGGPIGRAYITAKGYEVRLAVAV
jgi:hypothetical protein